MRTLLSVPMLKDVDVVGAIAIYRTEVRPFSDKQIELLASFASQAVIAIENARLLNELRESLQQQTATSEVLQVISSSPGELTPVFNAMLENACRICDAKFGTMFRFDGDAFYPVAELNTPPAITDFLRQRGRFLPAAGNALDKVWKSKETLHTVDDTKSGCSESANYAFRRANAPRRAHAQGRSACRNPHRANMRPSSPVF